MKNRLFIGLTISLLGLLLALVPQYLFPVCTKMIETAGGTFVPMKCYWSGKAELGLGLLILFTGVFYLLAKNLWLRLGICCVLILNIFLALSIPLFLIGGCAAHSMPCQLATFPAIYVLSGLLLLLVLANLIYLIIKCKFTKE